MTNSVYIKQCRAAYKLTELKLKIGFDEGDRVYDGEKVRLIGHDFINLTKKFRPDYLLFQFAMIKDDTPLVVGDKFYPSDITMKYGEYIAETIYKPVWIPTQEQLQDLLPVGNYITVLNKFIHFIEYNNSYHKYTDTKEQMWLKYFMYTTFKMLWDSLGSKWEVHITGDKRE